MRSYSDILRAETPTASISASPRDAEVAKARALLIRTMAGTAWSERSFVGKAVALLGHVLLWLVLAVCMAFFAGFGLVVVGVLGFDVGDPSCRGACEEAWFEWLIRASALTGVIGAGCIVGWSTQSRERKITRLKSLSPSALLRAYDRWRVRQEAAEAQARREEELDYLARRTAEHLSRRG